MTSTVTAMISRCPVCNSEPYIEQVCPWPRGHGAAPWSVGCYKMIPIEHFVGVNGDTRPDAILAWNGEAAKVAAMIDGTAGTNKR